MKNCIIKDLWRTKFVMEKCVKDVLERFRPAGCPFKNYTLYDLFVDWLKMYSWEMESGEISIVDYILSLKEKDEKAKVYGDAMIKIIKEAQK